MWGKSATNQSEGEGRERGCCLLQVYPCPVPILHLSTQPQHPAAIVGFLISFPRGCGVAGCIQVPRSQPRARRYRYELLLRTEMVRAPCVPRAMGYVHLALIGQVAVVPSLGTAPYPSFLSGFRGWGTQSGRLNTHNRSELRNHSQSSGNPHIKPSHPPPF